MTFTQKCFAYVLLVALFVFGGTIFPGKCCFVMFMFAIIALVMIPIKEKKNQQ